MKRLQQIRHALGSEAILTIVADDEGDHEALFAQLWLRIEQFERQFSRFLPDSELSYVNRHAGQATTVTPSFCALLGTARQLSQQTGGTYNPFILPALNRAGYVGSWPEPDHSDPALDYSNRRTLPSVADIQLTRDTLTMPAGSALDFGGIGKGYLLDQLGASMQAHAVQGYWFSLGGDIRCQGHDIDGRPWQIGIAWATRPTEALTTIHASDDTPTAIASSGITKRAGTAHGTPWHHLIDPRTGAPAETDILTATVVSQSATAADVYAKCLVIVGSQKADDFVRTHHIAEAWIQTVDGKAQHLMAAAKVAA